jgi:subtilisin family serine protease
MDFKAPFSNHGPCIDIFAPGDVIKSSWMDFGYKELSGTSMAAPHVTGVAALLLSVNPTLSFTDLRLAILGSALPFIIKEAGYYTKTTLLHLEYH